MSFMHKNFDPKKHTRYIPKNKNKYKGRHYPISRSKLETKFMEIIDQDPKVVEWYSESFYISYVLNGRTKRYYPDFFVKIEDPTFGTDSWVVELKPKKETRPPIPPKSTSQKSRKTKLYEKQTWEKNKAKWEYARRFCKKMGYTFKIITEKDLNGGK